MLSKARNKMSWTTYMFLYTLTWSNFRGHIIQNIIRPARVFCPAWKIAVGRYVLPTYLVNTKNITVQNLATNEINSIFFLFFVRSKPLKTQKCKRKHQGYILINIIFCVASNVQNANRDSYNASPDKLTCQPCARYDQCCALTSTTNNVSDVSIHPTCWTTIWLIDFLHINLFLRVNLVSNLEMSAILHLSYQDTCLPCRARFGILVGQFQIARQVYPHRTDNNFG